MTDINFYIPATFLLFFSLQKICSKKRGCKDKNIYFTTAIFSDNIFFLSSFPKKHQNQLANTDYISDITNLKKNRQSAVSSHGKKGKRQKAKGKRKERSVQSFAAQSPSRPLTSSVIPKS